MDNSLTYEYLIKAAYNCERGGANGKTDATIYREWARAIHIVVLQEQAIKSKLPLPDSRSVDQLEYIARGKAVGVRENVSNAISEVLKEPRPAEMVSKLRYQQKRLGINEYDEKVIDKVIEETWELFRELKLPNTQ
jgi:hypothetical protein